MLNAEIPNPSVMGGENLDFEILPSVGFIYPLGKKYFIPKSPTDRTPFQRFQSFERVTEGLAFWLLKIEYYLNFDFWDLKIPQDKLLADYYSNALSKVLMI